MTRPRRGACRGPAAVPVTAAGRSRRGGAPSPKIETHVNAAEFFPHIVSPAVVVRLDDGDIVAANPAAERLLGQPERELVRHRFPDLMLEERPEAWRALAGAVALDSAVPARDVRLRTPAGAVRRVACRGELIQSRSERLAMLLLQTPGPGTPAPGDAGDGALARHATVGLYRLDSKGRLTHANPALARLLGHESVKRLLEARAAFRDGLYADPRQALTVREALSGSGRLDATDAAVVRTDGGRVWIAETVESVRDAAGRTIGEIGTMVDVSAQRATEEALAGSEERYRTLVEHSQDGVFVTRAGRYLYVNRAYARMLGYEPDEMIGERFLRFYAPEERQRILELWQRRRAGHWEQMAYEVSLLKKDGSTRVFASVRSGPIHFGGELASTGTVRDITGKRRTERQLAAAERRYRGIVEHAVVGIYQSTPDGRLLAANPALAQLLGFDSVRLLRREVRNLRELYVDVGERDMLTARLESDDSVRGAEFCLRRHDGERIWVLESARTVRDENGAVAFYEGMLEDVTARKTAEDALHRSERVFRTLVENAHVGVLLLRGDRISYANSGLAAMLGYRDEQLAERPVTELFPPEERGCARELVALSPGARWQAERECRLLSSDGSRRVVGGMSAAAVMLEDDAVTVATVRDLTAEKAGEAKLRHLAAHDPLTGLPNRTLFRERLLEAMALGRRRKEMHWAVLFADLDAFKLVNDSLGHAAGDRLLVEVAARLKRAARAADVVCRHGGDEFVVLAEGITDQTAAVALAEDLETALAEPLRLGEHEIYSQVTIGIALGRPDYETPEAVLRDADAAMTTGKRLGKASHVVFDAAMHEAALDRLELESDLRGGLERDEFEPYYQPVIDIGTGRVVAFEALARWRHPQRGLLAPGAFLDVAEETGLILPLGWRGLDAALAACAGWREAGSDAAVAVNVSDVQFRSARLPERIADALERSGLPAGRLHLEVTETVFVENQSLARRMLERLRALGVKLYLDDFGTGYSALSYLRDLPFDALKIDRSFIEDLPRDTRNAAIVRSIVTLARELGLTVIAEGIERAEQAEALVAMGCTLFQGYHYGRPLAGAEALALAGAPVAPVAGRRRQ